jgi:N6-adenosine-specific RNA methylase IME4
MRPSAILFASDERDAFVLDIPSSIADAQGTSDSPWTRQLISSREPIRKPWKTTEPKSEKAKDNVRERAGGWESDSVRQLISEALEHIRLNYQEDWCLPRILRAERTSFEPDRDVDATCIKQKTSGQVQCTQQTAENRNIDSISVSHSAPEQDNTRMNNDPADLSNFLSNLIRDGGSYKTLETSWMPFNPPSYTNMSSNSSTLTLRLHSSTRTSPVTTAAFHIPPKSTLLLSDLPVPAPSPPNGFNLILLDPPWPNRSARRRSAYSIEATVDDAANLLRTLNLSAYLAPSGVVAVWVTNKAAIRSTADSWLAELGLVVREEWIWVKTTVVGEPVLPVNGTWRVPWEVLLVAGEADEEHEFKRRVFAAVPDEHSRKPCLKELFEMLLDLPTDYEACEVFARGLTAGWYAWGNECLLFNHEAYWSEKMTIRGH